MEKTDWGVLSQYGACMRAQQQFWVGRKLTAEEYAAEMDREWASAISGANDVDMWIEEFPEDPDWSCYHFRREKDRKKNDEAIREQLDGVNLIRQMKIDISQGTWNFSLWRLGIYYSYAPKRRATLVTFSMKLLEIIADMDSAIENPENE